MHIIFGSLIFFLFFILAVFIAIIAVVHNTLPSETVNSHEQSKENDIDFVFTWVNASDKEWIARKEKYSNKGRCNTFDSRRFGSGEVTNIEIETSVKSVLRCAPWCRTIWIATDNQVPDFINTLNGKEKLKVKVVYHHTFFSDPDILPTFNSHTIEANLYNIPGLAQKFVYMNDDMYLSSLVHPSHFFNGDIPVYRPIVVANVNKYKIIKNVMAWSNPSSNEYLQASSNLSHYCNNFLIWRYKHHAVPLCKSYFSPKIYIPELSKSTNCLCTSRFRSGDDIPPIHCAVLEAHKRGCAGIYSGKKYQIKYMESFCDSYNMNTFHEICVNNVCNKEEALAMKSKILRL